MEVRKFSNLQDCHEIVKNRAGSQTLSMHGNGSQYEVENTLKIILAKSLNMFLSSEKAQLLIRTVTIFIPKLCTRIL